MTFAGWPLRFGKERVEMVHVLLDPAAPPLVRMAASAAEMAITAAGFSHRTYWSPAELEAALPLTSDRRTSPPCCARGRARGSRSRRGDQPPEALDPVLEIRLRAVLAAAGDGADLLE